jgi:hypothetical protein
MAVVTMTCIVNAVGPAANGAETAPPVIYINLSSIVGSESFQSFWFFAAENCRHEMLTVALMAIDSEKAVNVTADAPAPGNETYTQIHRLYLTSQVAAFSEED